MSKEALEEAKKVLAASPLPNLRRLSLTVEDDAVVITGVVASFYLKQLAQEALRETARKWSFRVLNRADVKSQS